MLIKKCGLPWTEAHSRPSPTEEPLPSCLFHHLILAGYLLRFMLVQFVLNELLKKIRIGAN